MAEHKAGSIHITLRYGHFVMHGLHISDVLVLATELSKMRPISSRNAIDPRCTASYVDKDTMDDLAFFLSGLKIIIMKMLQICRMH